MRWIRAGGGCVRMGGLSKIIKRVEQKRQKEKQRIKKKRMASWVKGWVP